MNSSKIRSPIGIASSCSHSSSERKRKVRTKERDSAMAEDGIGKMRAGEETETGRDKENLDIRIKRRSKAVDASRENKPSRAVVRNNKRKGKNRL